MKKEIVLILVMTFVLFAGSASAQNSGYFEAKIGADIGGNFEISNSFVSESENTKAGLTLTGEYKIPYTSDLTFGAGISYQLDRGIDVPSGRDLSFVPVYGIIQYELENSPLYVLGHLGFNSFDYDIKADTNGGLYYGLGAGTNFGVNNQYVFEALYSVNNGEIEDNYGYSVDVEYSKFTFAVGRKF